LFDQPVNRRVDKRVVAIIGLHPPDQDVAVDQVRAVRHLGAILVEAFSRETFRREFRQSFGAIS
jgi:hypothetical protein